MTSLLLLAETVLCPVATEPDAVESMWGDFDQTQTVTDETSELFFSRDCFLSPEENDGVLQFTTFLSTSQPEPSVITSIVSFPQEPV